MSLPSEELLQHLDQSRAALRAAVDSVPPAHREQRPGLDRWSVAEVLEHLAIVERRIAGRLADALTAAKQAPSAAAGSSLPALDSMQVARLADRSQRFKTSEASEPRGGLSTEAAWSTLEEVRADIARLVRESDGYALEE